MDSVASFSFWVVGVMVMLAGQVLGLAWVITRYKNKFNSMKTEEPSSDPSVALDVFLLSLKCEMNGTSQGRGGLYSVIWIPIMDPDYRSRPI